MRGISISSTPSEPHAAPTAVATRLATPTAAAVASVPAIILLDDSDDDSPAAMRATAAAGECAPARAEGGLHQHNNPRDAKGKGAVSGAAPGALGAEAAPEAEEWSSDSEALGEFSRPAPRPAPEGGYAPALGPSAGGAAGVRASCRAAQPLARGHQDVRAASYGGGAGTALLPAGRAWDAPIPRGGPVPSGGGGGWPKSPARPVAGAPRRNPGWAVRGFSPPRPPPGLTAAPLPGGGLVTASTRAAAAPECREVHESARREAAQRRASPGGWAGEGG